MQGDQWEQVGLESWVIEKMMQTPEGDLRIFACDIVGDCGVITYDSTGASEMQVSGAEAIISSMGLTQLPDGIKSLSTGGLTLAVSQTDRCALAVGEQTKVWVTKDCGANWNAHSLEWTVQALAFDTLDSAVLIVGTRESGAFRIQVP